MKKKILIVSYFFSPNNVIGAIRPTKIAEKLGNLGHQVDVFTYGYTENDCYEANESNYRRYCIDNVKKEQKKFTAPKTFKKQSPIMRQVKSHVSAYRIHKKYKAFLDAFIKLYESELYKNEYDVIFTTFGPICALQAGLYVKKKNPGINWICDFRDPAVVKLHPTLYKPQYFYYQETACKNANSIVAVSDGYLKRICRGRYSEKSYMIPNGYEEKDRNGFENKVVNDGKLHLAYVGALYFGTRDIGPLFKAIKELDQEGLIKKENIVFDYAGSEFQVLQSQAKQHSVDDIVVNHNRLPRKECLELQFSSSILVLSTWNNKGEEGVFPGKFLEYMLIGKPIIAVVDGGLANSEVKQVMDEGNFGVTYEAATASEDFNSLKAYIKKQYDNVINNGNVDFSPKKEVLDRYNYDNIIQRIEDIL